MENQVCACYFKQSYKEQFVKNFLVELLNLELIGI